MSIVELPFSSSGYAAGANAGNYLAKSADAAANFACSLYKSYPGVIVGNAAASAIKGLYDSACASRPSGLPAPPAQEFTGGQCKCTGYNVTYSINNPGSSNSFTAFLVGRIGGVRKSPNNNINAPWKFEIIYYPCSGGSETGAEGKLFVATGDNSTNVIITGVAKANGQADDCGNPAPRYPDVVPPPGYQNGNGNVTYNDGVSLTVPLVYAPISATADVGFTVNVGGINMKFDLGGVTINTNPTKQPTDPGYPGSDGLNDSDKIDDLYRNRSSGGSFTDADRTTLNNTNSTVNSTASNVSNIASGVSGIDSKVTETGQKVDDILNKVKQLNNCCDSSNPDDPTKFDPTPKTEDDPKKEDNIPNLSFVKVELTTLPPQSKVQYGAGSPDVVFAGWFEWIVAGFALPREPIHFQKNIYQAPSFATGYAYTLVNGAKGKATIYKRKAS